MRLLSCVLATGLVLTLPLAAQTAAPEKPAVAGQSTRWEKDISVFEAADKANPPPKKGVVFVGSSTLKLWKNLPSDFSEVPAINRGFGGSQVSDSVQYADRIIIPYEPRVVVTYAGGNDINAGKTPAEVVEQYKMLDEKLRAALPDVIIVHVTLSPTIARLKDESKVQEFNRMMADYVKDKPKMVLVDTYSKLIGTDGQPQAKMLRADKLHPSEEGYRILMETIKPAVDKTYQDAGGTLAGAPAK